MASQLHANTAFTLNVFGNQRAGNNRFYIRSRGGWIPASNHVLTRQFSSAIFSNNGRMLVYRSALGANTKLLICDVVERVCVLVMHVPADGHYIADFENFVISGAWPTPYSDANSLVVGLHPGRANVSVLGPDDVDLDVLRIRPGRPIRMVPSAQMRDPRSRQATVLIVPAIEPSVHPVDQQVGPGATPEPQPDVLASVLPRPLLVDAAGRVLPPVQMVSSVGEIVATIRNHPAFRNFVDTTYDADAEMESSLSNFPVKLVRSTD